MPTRQTLAAVIAVALAFTLGVFAADKVKPRSTYVNAEYGFTLQPPGFSLTPPGGNTIAASFSAPGKNNFATTVNVVVQGAKTTRDQYIADTMKSFEAMGMKVNSKKLLQVNGHDAVSFEYEGKLSGRDLRFNALAVIDRDRVILMTGAALQADFAEHSAAIQQSLDSFRME